MKMVAARIVNEAAFDGKSVSRLEVVSVEVRWPDAFDPTIKSSNPYLTYGSWKLAEVSE